MFDINLLNSPGIQNNSSKPKENRAKNKKLDSIENSSDNFLITNNDSSNKIFKVFVILGLIVIIVFCLFKYNYLKINKFTSVKINKSYKIEEIIPELQKNSDKINVNYMVFSKNEFSLQLEMRNADLFYKILDKFSNIIFDKVKGYKINSNLMIDINVPWRINENNNFDINLLNKELSDFNPNLKKELYKDKLIIITDTMQLFNFIEFLFEINIIKNFNIDIEPIQSLPNAMKLYKLIVY